MTLNQYQEQCGTWRSRPDKMRCQRCYFPSREVIWPCTVFLLLEAFVCPGKRKQHCSLLFLWTIFIHLYPFSCFASFLGGSSFVYVVVVVALRCGLTIAKASSLSRHRCGEPGRGCDDFGCQDLHHWDRRSHLEGSDLLQREHQFRLLREQRDLQDNDEHEHLEWRRGDRDPPVPFDMVGRVSACENSFESADR